jgi:hypothetical protein
MLDRVSVEIRDVADGLWIWRQRHPAWREGFDWEPFVNSVAVRSQGVALVLDPLAPPPHEADAWARLDAFAPQHVVILKPDHVRDVDLFARRYGARPHGPYLFWRDDIPECELEPLEPGDVLPGGLLACHDGRGKMETPLYLPEHRTLVFADALTAPGGVLRVWATPWHQERALPGLRGLLELRFEHVIVAHGEPLHGRADFEAALERAPWSG